MDNTREVLAWLVETGGSAPCYAKLEVVDGKPSLTFSPFQAAWFRTKAGAEAWRDELCLDPSKWFAMEHGFDLPIRSDKT